ncbi:MAG: hypothetical protein P8J87_03990 [Verrucomicrobiales bacterium]|nr:hypothetical protein [Verrucomicrobiales bacterium]
MDAFKWLSIGVVGFFGYIAYSINTPSSAAGVGSSVHSNGDVIAANTSNFNTAVLDSVSPVLLEFYADW